MKKLFVPITLVVLFLFSFFSVTLGKEKQDPSEEIVKDLNIQSGKTFTILCVDDQSVGFNWKNKQWVLTNFIPRKLIIQKVKIKSGSDDSSNCRLQLKFQLIRDKGLSLEEYEVDPARKVIEGPKFEWLQGCYNIREHGKEFIPLVSSLCSEFWELRNDKYELSRVNCNNTGGEITFSPNGYFHHSYVHSNLSETDDYKDSLMLSVGKCSVIKE